MSSRDNLTPPPTYLQAVMLDIADTQEGQINNHQSTFNPIHIHIHRPTKSNQNQEEAPNIPPRTISTQPHHHPSRVALPLPQTLSVQDAMFVEGLLGSTNKIEGKTGMYCFVGFFIFASVLVLLYLFVFTSPLKRIY